MNAHISNKTPACCSSSGEGHDNSERHIDPVCGMPVADGDHPLTMHHEGICYYFCSQHCLKVFAKKKDQMVAGETLLRRKNRALLVGSIGFASLLGVFLVVLILANQTLDGALYEVGRLWYWVLLLATGFGLQLGLFMHIRYKVREQMIGATAEVAASGAVSTGSMIACCSHGLVNLLPVFGISAAAAFLARYQLPFILFGVFSNLMGVTIMLGLARKNGIKFSNPLLKWLIGLNLKLSRVLLIVVGVVAIAISILAV